MGEKREVDPVNGFQIISHEADADAAESPGSTAASEYTGHCIGLSHTALTGLVHGEVSTKSYCLCGQPGNRHLAYGEFMFFLSDTKQSHSKTSHFVFYAIFKMAAKHDSITKQSYILRLFYFNNQVTGSLQLNGHGIFCFKAMASHSETNHLVSVGTELALRLNGFHFQRYSNKLVTIVTFAFRPSK